MGSVRVRPKAKTIIVESGVEVGTDPIIYNITMTSADTEYSQAFPLNTKKFLFRCRDATVIRFAFETGKVAGPIEPYFTLPINESHKEDFVDLNGIVLYVACGVDAKVVELLVWVGVGEAFDGENFTVGYDEFDPNHHITRTPFKVTHIAYRNEDAYLYKDKGIDFFEDFEILFELTIQPSGDADLGALGHLVTLANIIDDYFAMINVADNISVFCIRKAPAGDYKMGLYAFDGAGHGGESIVLAKNTKYYCVLKRVGTNITLFIYSDMYRTNLVDSVVIDPFDVTKKFRYLYACQTYNDAMTIAITFELEYMTIK